MKKENLDEIKTVLTQIRNVLIVIAVILVVNVIVTGMNSNDASRYGSSGATGSTGSSSEESQELPEYDVSAFTEITVDEMFNKVNTSGYQVVYIGRSGCGYCKLFLEPMRKAQTNFGYNTLYIDLDKVTSEGAAKMQGISDDLNTYFGRTPMILIYKDGEYKDMWLGYAEYETFESYLIEQGMTKK